jgi:hypothetical protein
MTYDIELGQGDTDTREITLYENGEVIDIPGYTVKCKMEFESGAIHDDLTCTLKSVSVVNNLGETVQRMGAVEVTFSDTETEESGVATGKFFLTNNGRQTTYPLGIPLSIKVWRK